MIFWDVNLWVYAFRSDSPFHLPVRQSLETVIQTGKPFLYCPAVAVSFLRLVTNPRIFIQPSSVAEAWGFIDVLSGQPSASEVSVDQMTMGIFKHITLISQSGGNSIPDALLAALAIRHDAILHTADKGFLKYQGLQVEIVEA